MKIKYVCDVCGEQFEYGVACRLHEAEHLSGDEKLKYQLIHSGKDVCDFCDKSYYVYGCERDCEYKECRRSNNYKDFKPVEPFHNKRIHGV